MTDTPDIEMFIAAKDRVRELYELIYNCVQVICGTAIAIVLIIKFLE